MATIKIVLRKKANKDGTFPLALRITKDRKTSFIHLGYHLRADEWMESEQRVKSSHPNSKRLNNLLLTKKAEASDKLMEAETQTDEISATALRSKIKRTASITFFIQANSYLERNKADGSYNAYLANLSRLKLFREFLSDRDIAFSDITITLLERYKMYLKSERKNSDRTIANHMMLIRAIFSHAIKEGGANAKHYPFGSDKLSIKRPDSTKIGLSLEDVTKLENIVLDNPRHDLARDLWLTSFYFAGMRISDVLRLRWSDFQNGRLHYTMGKNSKTGSLSIHAKAEAIIEKYAGNKTTPDSLIFPNLRTVKDFKDKFEVKKRIAYHVNRTNLILKESVAPAAELHGAITTHIARHTFATLAGDKIPVQMLQKLYRHSDVRTTIGYQANFVYQDADDALAAVIGS